MHVLPSRKIAIEQGFTQYQAVRPCGKGHFGARYLSGRCVECARESNGSELRGNQRVAKLGSTQDRIRVLRKRCAAKNQAFDLSPVEVMRLYVRDPICPVTQRRMVRPGDDGPLKDQVCIETIDPKAGFVAGNVILISHEAQRLLKSIDLGQASRLVDLFYRRTS